MNTNRRWILPCLILILLFGAWYFRWDYEATSTQGNKVFKWKSDRWTGEKWLEIHTDSYFLEKPIPVHNYGYNKEWDTRYSLNGIWFILVFLTSSWLVISVTIIPWIKNKLYPRKTHNPCLPEEAGVKLLALNKQKSPTLTGRGFDISGHFRYKVTGVFSGHLFAGHSNN